MWKIQFKMMNIVENRSKTFFGDLEHHLTEPESKKENFQKTFFELKFYLFSQKKCQILVFLVTIALQGWVNPPG